LNISAEKAMRIIVAGGLGAGDSLSSIKEE